MIDVGHMDKLNSYYDWYNKWGWYVESHMFETRSILWGVSSRMKALCRLR